MVNSESGAHSDSTHWLRYCYSTPWQTIRLALFARNMLIKPLRQTFAFSQSIMNHWTPTAAPLAAVTLTSARSNNHSRTEIRVVGLTMFLLSPRNSFFSLRADTFSLSFFAFRLQMRGGPIDESLELYHCNWPCTTSIPSSVIDRCSVEEFNFLFPVNRLYGRRKKNFLLCVSPYWYHGFWMR